MVFGDVAPAADIMTTNIPALATKLSYNIINFKQDAGNTKRHDIMLQLADTNTLQMVWQSLTRRY